MDSSELTNSPPSGHFADAGWEYHLWLTDEENRRATFSRQSATVTTTEQAERQQIPSTGDEQNSNQRVLADFDVSLASLDPLIVDEPEDTFAALAAHQSLTFEEDPRHSFNSELGFIESSTVEDFHDFVLAELEGSDVFGESLLQPEQLWQSVQPGPLEQLWSLGKLWQLEQPEQPQGESDARGIIIPESANPDTDLNKSSDKRRASKPRAVVIGDIPSFPIKESVDPYFHESLSRSERPTVNRQKLDIDSTGIEFSPIIPEMVARSQPTLPEKSVASRKRIKRQNLDQSLLDRIKKETEKWVLVRKNVPQEFICSFPNCGRIYTKISHLKTHIFTHIHISKYKCTYPACGNKPYFRDASALNRHIMSYHTYEKPYFCELCSKCFRRSDSYKNHMSHIHGIAL